MDDRYRHNRCWRDARSADHQFASLPSTWNGCCLLSDASSLDHPVWRDANGRDATDLLDSSIPGQAAHGVGNGTRKCGFIGMPFGRRSLPTVYGCRHHAAWVSLVGWETYWPLGLRDCGCVCCDVAADYAHGFRLAKKLARFGMDGVLSMGGSRVTRQTQ